QLVSEVAEGGHTVRGWGTASQWLHDVRAAIATSHLANTDAEYLLAVVVRSYGPSLAMTGATHQHTWQQPLAACMDTWHTCASALGKLEEAPAIEAGAAA